VHGDIGFGLQPHLHNWFAITFIYLQVGQSVVICLWLDFNF